MSTPPPISPKPPSSPSRKSIWSLVLALLGVFCLCPLTAIPAIILGHLALREFKGLENAPRGRSMAFAGLIIGYMAVFIQILFFIYMAFTESINYHIKNQFHKPDYVFHLAIRSPDCQVENVAPVLSRRLRNQGVPHSIIAHGQRDMEVRVALDHKNPEDIRKTITSSGFLAFRLVHQDNEALVQQLFSDQQPPWGYEILHVDVNGQEKNFLGRLGNKDSVADAQENLFWRKTPPDYELMLQHESVNGRKVYTPYFIHRKIELDGTRLKTARVDFSGMNEPVVAIQFNREGNGIFQKLTEDFGPGGSRNPHPAGRRLAIIVNGTIYSAPIIREPITGGGAEISGNFTTEEANFLANVLQAGHLPCPLAVTSENPLE